MHIYLNKRNILVYTYCILAIISCFFIFDFKNEFILLFGRIITFLFFTFAPGYFFLKILKIKSEENPLMVLIYSVALSLFIVMFSGFLLNLAIFLGFKALDRTVISFFLIFISFSLLLIYQFRLSNKEVSFALDTESIKYLVLFSYLPFLAILGSFLMNTYGLNLLILVLLILISLIPLLIFKIPSKAYPIILFAVSLSLLLHTSLISDEIWGSDVQGEYYLAKNVLDNEYWNYSATYNYEILTRYNSLLSVGILPTVYISVLDIELKWFYKLICPFILAIVALGIYMIYIKHFDKETSLIASYYLISFSTFYLVSLEAPRQIIGMLFLVLILDLILSNNVSEKKEKLILLILSFGLITSHYGISYIFLFILMIYVISCKFLEKRKFGIEKFNFKSSSLGFGFLVIFFVFAIAWYIYVSNSVTFDIIVKISSQVLNSIGEIGDPFGTSLTPTLTNKAFYIDLSNIFRVLTFSFIPLGLYYLILNKVRSNYIYLSALFLLFFVLSVSIPYLAPAMGLLRINIVLMIILAPLSFLGCLFLFQIIVNRLNFKGNPYLYSKIFYSLILSIIIILNTGVPHVLYSNGYDEYGGSFSINKDFDYALFNSNDIESSKWVLNHFKGGENIFADNYRRLLFLRFGHFSKSFRKNEKIPKGSYIFLNSWNLNEKKYSLQIPVKSVWLLEYRKIEDFDIYNKIYENGNSSILYL